MSDRAGNVAMMFGLALPALGIGLAGAIDLNTWYSAKNRLQGAADGAALAAARELQLASATTRQVSSAGEGYVRTSLAEHGPQPTHISVEAATKERTVTVGVTAEVSPLFSRILYDGLRTISARAVAKLAGSAPVCVIGLDPAMAGTLHFEKNAKLTANRCAIYSNSESRAGIQGEDGAQMTAALFCSAGGSQVKKSRFSPDPVNDCPTIKDPLAKRADPTIGGCDAVKKVVKGKTTVSLSPGTYCGGLTVTEGSVATLLPGIYVIKDGPLLVNKGSTFQGQNVGLHFSGDKSSLLFDKDSIISLTAPKDGVMAGLLMSEERRVLNPAEAPTPETDPITGLLAALPPLLPTAAPPMRQYRIISDQARVLLGTIYLPSGRLMIDSSKPVADRSAYTVIVVRRLDLFDGPNLYLNADYGATDIPIPEGVGPVAGNVMLSE